MSLTYWRAQNWTQYPTCASSVLSRCEGFLSPPAGSSLKQFQDAVGLHCHKDALLAHTECAVWWHSISFNAGFSFPDGPNMHGDLELVTPRYSTWHLPLMNFKRLLSDHFFSLPRIPWCFGVLFLFKSVACFNLFSKLFVFFPSLPANSQGTTGNHPPAEGSEGWSQPFKHCSSDSFQSTSLTTYLGHPSSVCQWGCYRTVCQKNNSIICSSLIHQQSGFLIEGYQVSQAPFCSHELMLTTLKNKKKESSALTVLWISTRQELWGQL